MYEDYENLNYLAHHGILGMKWGKQNGPPYPLSEAKHEKVIARAEKKKIRQEKHAESRRKKILNDPKKLVKYRSEFSKDEIDSALDKMNSVDKVRDKIQETDIQKRIKKIKLTNKQKRLASTPSKLEKNAHKFTPEELKEAIQYLRNTEEIFKLKVDKARRPLVVGNTVSDYIKGLSNLFSNWNSLHDQSVKLTGQGLNNEQRNKQWIYDNMSSKYFDLFYPKKGDKNKNKNKDPKPQAVPQASMLVFGTDADVNKALEEKKKLEILTNTYGK